MRTALKVIHFTNITSLNFLRTTYTYYFVKNYNGINHTFSLKAGKLGDINRENMLVYVSK